MKHTIFHIILAWCISMGPMFGQTEMLKTGNAKADKAYQYLGYKEAIDLYKQGKMDMATIERIANGYRLNGDYWNAERWYSQIVSNSGNPLNHLHYAQALHSNGKLEEAKAQYLLYDKLIGGSDMRGQRLAKAIDNQFIASNEKEVEVTHEPIINSPKLDFSPAFYGGGIVFVSNRSNEDEKLIGNTGKDSWTGDDFTTLFFTSVNEQGKLDKPAVFETHLANRFHEGPLSFSRSGDQLFYTKNNPKSKGIGKGEVKLKIYFSEKNGQGWSAPTLVDLGANNANDAHPSLSPDGQKLYFTSDREGGFGGMDLYVASFTEGKWGNPTNLGTTINTPGNELFPFIHDDGTLYFASDGWQSLGGLDIFFAEAQDDGSFSAPVNLGEPFNSPKDDFGYVVDVLGIKGYFTSSREGGFGKDDIYSFTLPNPHSNKKRQDAQPELSICVYDAGTQQRLEGAKVTILEQVEEGAYEGMDDDFVVKLVPTDTDGEYTISLRQRDPFVNANLGNETYLTDGNGEFLAKFEQQKRYMFIVKITGYEEEKVELSAEELEEAMVMGSYCIPVNAIDCISINGVVRNKRYHNTIPGATVALINLCTGDVLTKNSGAEGEFEFPCLPCNCDFIIQGAKANFKQDNNLVSTVGMDCLGIHEPITKDLLLTPVLEPNATPNIVNYGQAEDESPIHEFRKPQKGKLNENWLPTDGLNSDAELVDKVLKQGLTVELEDIYYDFDKYYIRPDAAIELDKVVALMQRHSYLMVQLRSHTDSRADGKYNQVLSERRAKAAMDYIVKKGISKDRIAAYGYGENWLTNECGDGVPCPEPDHQMNRRTEIKIFKQ